MTPISPNEATEYYNLLFVNNLQEIYGDRADNMTSDVRNSR